MGGMKMYRLPLKICKNAEDCNFEIGSKVVMVNCSESEKYGERVWIIRSEAWDMCGSVIILLKGYSGGFNVNNLMEVSDE